MTNSSEHHLKHGLSEETMSALKSVFSKYNIIENVLLYGSRAMGNFKPGSDIDLVLVAPTMELSQLLKIQNEVDDLMLPYKVDISLFHKIENSDLISHINRIGIEF